MKTHLIKSGLIRNSLRKRNSLESVFGYMLSKVRDATFCQFDRLSKYVDIVGLKLRGPVELDDMARHQERI